LTLKTLIVDDEFPARQELRCILEDIGNVEVIGECNNGLDALNIIRKDKIDVVFLDIEMPLISGLSLAKQLSEIDNPPKIVFTTGFSEFALDAFELGGIDYILKPYTQERLEITISRLIKKSGVVKTTRDTFSVNSNKSAPAKIALWSNDRLLLIDPEKEIIFLKAENRKTKVFTQKGTMEIALPLKEWEKRFKNRGFMRVHKSYIVNIAFIKEVVPWFNDTYLLKINEYLDEEIVVSRHYLPGFKKAFQL